MPISCCNDCPDPLYVDGGRRLRIITTDNDGERTSPTTLTVVMTDPSGNETTYTWAGNDIQEDSEGNFHFDNDWDEAGLWLYAVISTGAVHDKVKGSIEVLS